MSLVRWHCSNNSDLDFDFDINPSRDTGWMEEPLYAEHHPINAKQTILQIGGYKSRPRVAEGITKSLAVHDKLVQLHRKANTWTLKDQHNDTFKVFIVELTWEELNDASNLLGTFKYKIKLLRRPATG